MVSIVFQSLYFFLPVFVAYLAVKLTKPIWKYPIQKRFGQHTWTNLVAAAVNGTIVFWIQKMVYTPGQALALIDYQDFTLTYGLLLGVGTVLGEMIKDFFKIRKKIAHWWFWDETSFALGALIIGFLVYVPSAAVSGIIILSALILHLVVSYVAQKYI